MADLTALAHAAYIVAAVALMADLLIMKPAYTWPGLVIAVSGAPVYWWLLRRRPTWPSGESPI